MFSNRCSGVVLYRGGLPPTGVRGLAMVGQFDEFGGNWEQIPRDNAVIEPGAGHFAWSARNAKYLAAWIRQQPTDKAAYEAGLIGKKDQFIRWNDPFWVDTGVRYFFTDLKWVGDGQTFEVHPVYTNEHSRAPILRQSRSAVRW